MADWKVTLFYNQFNQGWTETYYHTNQSTDPDSAKIQGVLLLKLLELRGAGCTIKAQRISNEAKPFDALLITDDANIPANQQLIPDISGVSAQLELRGAEGANRMLDIRGLRDSQTRRNFNGGSDPTAAFRQTINNVVSELVSWPASIKKLVPVAVNPWKPVSNFEVVEGNESMTRVVTPAGHGFEEGDNIYFGRVDQCVLPGLTGHFTVFNPEATYFDILYRWKLKQTQVDTDIARVRRAAYTYVPITSGRFRKFTTRDTGRPFGVRRGRSRGLRCRQ